MNKIRLFTWILSMGLGNMLFAQTQSIPFDEKHWDFSQAEVRAESYKGKEALAVKGRIDVKDVVFHNGIIEVDLNFPFQRNFSGLIFRTQGNGTFEEFYVRPHQMGNPDACQYTPVFPYFITNFLHSSLTTHHSMKPLLLLISLCTMTSLSAQTELPLREIPPVPEDYSSGNVLARLVEGLGYRYYWATEGLRAEDLAYKISEDSRTTGETLDHLLGLSTTIMRTTLQIEVERIDYDSLSFEEKRRMTLENLARASETLRGKSQEQVGELEISFGGGRTFPYWNMINGPIADAIYHTGQIVSYRRASGNPINPKVNVFAGKNRE